MISNVVTTTVIYIVTVASLLLWVFRSGQRHTPATRKTALHIVFRTVPFCLIFFFVCYWGNLNPHRAAIMLGFVILVSLFDPFLIGLFFLIIAEWIIGFPSKKDFFVEGFVHSQEDIALDPVLIEAVGETVTALRPSGSIVVDENEYEAKSDLGYIKQGRNVIITGRKGSAFIVREEAEVS